MSIKAENPPAVAVSRLEAVHGVLGRIGRERLADYENFDTSALRPQPGPPFAAALRGPRLSVIAEIKRASPSQGAIAPLDPAVTARQYTAGGASALSVLTEPRHFGGELQHLQQARSGSSLPLLRKDFTVHPAQLFESAAAGASSVLLIVALLGELTGDYLELAGDLGLDALVEVHDESELDLALASGARIIGVNNRDLTTLEIDLETAPRLIRRARTGGFDGLLVAESGYRDAEQLMNVSGLADAVLIGTSLAGSGDPGAALTRLLAHPGLMSRPV